MAAAAAATATATAAAEGGGGGGGGKENKTGVGVQSHQQDRHSCRCKSFGQRCSHLVKKQRAKFYILRRCVAMLVCWRERGDP